MGVLMGLLVSVLTVCAALVLLPGHARGIGAATIDAFIRSYRRARAWEKPS